MSSSDVSAEIGLTQVKARPATAGRRVQKVQPGTPSTTNQNDQPDASALLTVVLEHINGQWRVQSGDVLEEAVLQLIQILEDSQHAPQSTSRRSSLRAPPVMSNPKQFKTMLESHPSIKLQDSLNKIEEMQIVQAQMPGGQEGEKERPEDEEGAGSIYATFARQVEKGEAMPSDVLMDRANGAIARIGPLSVQDRNLGLQFEEMKHTKTILDGMENVDLLTVSTLEYNLKKVESLWMKTKKKLDHAYGELDAIVLSTSQAIGGGLVSDIGKYSSVMQQQLARFEETAQKLTDTVERIDNRGPLEIGQEVQVVPTRGEPLCRARVEQSLSGDTYELSLWTVYALISSPYDEGFDTQQPRKVTYPRRRIYSNSKGGCKQSDAFKCPDGQELRCKDPRYLLRLYSVADETLSHLKHLVEHVDKHVGQECEGIVAPLKSMQRTMVKVTEKYKGDFSCMTDLARMTFKCSGLDTVLSVLNLIDQHEGFKLLRIKNRLMEEYDAAPMGGYRDMLTNVLCLATNHVCEIQITLRPLLDVKMSGGHVNYELARVLGLFDPAITGHFGSLSDRVLKRVESGLVKTVKCQGPSNVAQQFPTLIKSLRSKTCVLTSLELISCDWPENQEIDEFLLALGPHTRELKVKFTDICGGEIPSEFFTRTPDLRYLNVTNAKVRGSIPSTIGGCVNLDEVVLWGNQLSGSIPSALGDLRNLKNLQLQTNQLTGEIPSELGQCANLEKLHLDQNKLSGSIPSALGDLRNLKELRLYENQLTGEIPPELGQCTNLEYLLLKQNKLNGSIPSAIGDLRNLKSLWLHENQLTGEIPPELGQCTNLERLVLNGNQVTGDIPPGLVKCTKL